MRPVKLSVVRNEKKRAASKDFRKRLFERVREVTTNHGEEIAGFALVTWDSRGQIYSVVRPGGAFPKRFVSGMVSAVLIQHDSADVAESEIHKILWPK